MSRNRPSVWQVGKVTVRNEQWVVRGWGIGLCVSACMCHKDPVTGKLAAEEDEERGTLGLLSHKPHCTCCEPWKAEELHDILDSLAKVDKLVAGSATEDPT